MQNTPAVAASNKFSTRDLYALVFGLFLGLAIVKFGNPVVLDHKILVPVSLAEAWSEPWPLHWAHWFLPPLVLAGIALALKSNVRWRGSRWLWLLPLVWLGWQFVSSTQTVDAVLTAAALWQFAGCVAGYALGVLVLGNGRALNWLLAGVLAAFTFCLVRAVDQRVFEFPASHRMLVDGERTGWTNLSPELFRQLKQDNVIVVTNGVDVANPAILKKFANGRVSGTLVYPNALAGLVLLLLPVALALAFTGTRRLRPVIRATVIALACFLGATGFFWTGSKLGWLMALGLVGVCLLRLRWPVKLKLTVIALMAVAGLGIFAIRFQSYFAAGATSVGARFDYWHAAAQTTWAHPLVGTGPGTFQRPYEKLKSPESEMARLAHNDYLEQFSDSGIIGGLAYAAWIVLALATVGRRLWQSENVMLFMVFLGLLGWFIQGIGEFSLYIPALAWTAFTLLGCLLGRSGNQSDNQSPTR